MAESQSRSEREALKENEEVTYSNKGSLTDDQRACYELFCDLVGGEHHLTGKVRICSRGLFWNSRYSSLATYDFDGLTRLVLLAHDRCIRVEIVPSGPGMVGLTAHKRHKRDGSMYERHPTMEDHIAALRGTVVSEPGPSKGAEALALLAELGNGEYETEYDGSMMPMCIGCGGGEDATGNVGHSPSCVYVRAAALCERKG